MIIYIDENMPPQLARGFDIIQRPLNANLKEDIQVLSIKDEFGQGAKDEDWIPIAGKQKACVITQDYNIQKTKHQRELYYEHELGMFFFKSSSKKGLPYFEMVKQLVKHWEDITKVAIKKPRPFAYRITQRGGMEEM